MRKEVWAYRILLGEQESSVEKTKTHYLTKHVSLGLADGDERNTKECTPIWTLPCKIAQLDI
jgi:hypothetical protein